MRKAFRGRNTPSIGIVAVFPPVLLLLLLASYFILAFHPSSVAYRDYVDGYYLYAAHRMAQGVVLYSGVMGVQPPGIYIVGDLLFRLRDALSTVRAYAGVLHDLTILLVYLTALRLYHRHLTALFAALLFSLAHFSLLWSQTFDPNPLVSFLSLASLYLLLGESRAQTVGAGLLGAFALATKVWYFPVGLATVLFLARYRRECCWLFLLSFVATLSVVATLGTLSASNAFWQGLFVQDASVLSAASLEVAIYQVLQYDWPLLLLAVAGFRHWRHVTDGVGELAQWYLLAAATVLGATIKVGTFAPIFQFAEPALAIVAAAYLGAFFDKRASQVDAISTMPVAATSRPQDYVIPAVIIVLLAYWSLPTLAQLSQTDDASVRRLVFVVGAHSGPGSTLLAPPFYLYLSGRVAQGEYADINLWGLLATRGDAKATALQRQTLQDLAARRIPLVLADIRVRHIPGVDAALHRYYHRLAFQDPLSADRAVELWSP